MNNLTSNQYYSGLNNRFEKRLRELTRMGFKTDHVEFTKHFPRMSVNRSFMMHADRRAWRDKLYR
jgi:hypothetical protein